MGFHTESMVKTRKPHQCWGCGKKIDVGETVKSVRGTNDSEDAVGTWYYCTECDDYMENRASEDDRWHWENYGIFLGDIKTCRDEYERERPKAIESSEQAQPKAEAVGLGQIKE